MYTINTGKRRCRHTRDHSHSSKRLFHQIEAEQSFGGTQDPSSGMSSRAIKPVGSALNLLENIYSSIGLQWKQSIKSLKYPKTLTLSPNLQMSH